jgi:hypothetical protein
MGNADVRAEAALALLLALVSSCSLAPAKAAHTGSTARSATAPADGTRDAKRAERTRFPVVLVTIDGARWQEIFTGADPSRLGMPAPLPTAAELMPHLHAMQVALGVPGAGVIRATGPNYVSSPGYREILTGRASVECQSNDCPRIASETLLDEASAAGLRVAAFASWERIDFAATARPGAFYVSAGRAGDPTIEPWPGAGDFRPDELTAERALEHLVREEPDLLFLGLGEPDEYAHHGDYAGYVRSLRAADAILGRLEETLARMGARGAETHVFVTADHGRAGDFRGHGGWAPESARVWLFASGPRVRARGAVQSPRERHLSDLAPTLRVVLGLRTPKADLASGSVLSEILDDG